MPRRFPDNRAPTRPVRLGPQLVHHDRESPAELTMRRDRVTPGPVQGDCRRVHDLCSARVEKRRDQREHFAGPPCHADVRGPGEHGELRVRQELEHLHHVGQR